MFELVTVLLSFVFAIALTHLLTSSTELVWARDRLRFSGLQALWMLSAALSILVNWIALEPLHAIKQWNIAEIEIQFFAAVVQYYTCSLISMRPAEHGIVDMGAFYERERPPIFSAYSTMMVISMFQNWWDRKTYGLSASDFFEAEAIVFAMLVLTLTAGWAKPKSLQWTAACLMLALQAYFLVEYAIAM
jgi:hypothetical protein